MADMTTYTKPLEDLAKKLKPKNILEIGIGHGHSARVWLASGADVLSVDRSDWAGVVGELSKNPKFKHMIADSAIITSLKDKYDLIYIDGDHTYEGAKRDMENAIPLLAPNGVIAIDDYGVGYSAVDVRANGEPVEGEYGVKQAADEVFKDWKRLDIQLANGGICVTKA